MQAAFCTETTILPGRRIEISSPELPEGTRVQVIIVWPIPSPPRFGSALEFLESLPPGPRAFKTWEEYEHHLEEERHAWDRCRYRLPAWCTSMPTPPSTAWRNIPSTRLSSNDDQPHEWAADHLWLDFDREAHRGCLGRGSGRQAGDHTPRYGVRDAAQEEKAPMKVTNVYRKSHRTPEQQAKANEVREMFQDWQPGPEELLASGRWKGPVIVAGQQEFWKAIRRLRSCREAQGLTLKDVSERCGIDVATLSKLENGKQANPTLFTMLLYAGALGKRLHFSVRDRPAVALRVSEIRDVSTASNGTPRARRRRAKPRQKEPSAPKTED